MRQNDPGQKLGGVVVCHSIRLLQTRSEMLADDQSRILSMAPTRQYQGAESTLLAGAGCGTVEMMKERRRRSMI